MSLATLIILIVLVILSVWIIKSTLQKKGACSDCDCSCAIKDEIKKNNNTEINQS